MTTDVLQGMPHPPLRPARGGGERPEASGAPRGAFRDGQPSGTGAWAGSRRGSWHGSWHRSWQWATGRGGDLRRLDGELARLQYRLAYRQAALGPAVDGPGALVGTALASTAAPQDPAASAGSSGSAGPAGSGGWGGPAGSGGSDGSPDARAALSQAVTVAAAAREACESRSSEAAWALFAQAAELEVLCLGRDEVDAMRDSLRSEVDKDPDAGWWREASLELLAAMSRESSARVAAPARKGVPATPPPDRERPAELARDRFLLKEALRKRNESLSLRYAAMAAHARDRIWLAAMLIALLTVAGVLIKRHGGETVDSLDLPWIAGAAAVAGAIGSVTSAMQRLCSTPKAQMATRLQGFTVVIIQVLIGTVAALTLYVASVAGVVPLGGGHKVFLLVLAAFGSGFTERLVVYKPRSR